jgi:hypothetical protein
MKRDLEFFGGDEVELELVYIAKKLKEALKLEGQLSDAGHDYLVEADKYRGGLIFQTERVGAFFYVPPEKADQVRKFLADLGYRAYVAGEGG